MFGGPGGPDFMARMYGRGAFNTITDSPLFARGDVDKPTDRVPRGVPAVLSAEQNLNIPSGTSGRRELADWLVSNSNPLTARVNC